MVQFWSLLTQPSLVRRLVLAQLALVAVIWLAVLTYLVYESSHDEAVFDFKRRAEMVLATTQALPATPEHADMVREALAKIDSFQRSELGDPDNASMRLTMSVFRAGELVYVTPGEPGPLVAPSLGKLSKVVANGRKWLVYSQSRRSNAGGPQDVQVNFVTPGDTPAVIVSLGNNGVLLLPLLVSLPFLILPAWISIRLALRPWRALRDEIAARDPLDLSSLKFVPKHRELKPLVASMNHWLFRLRGTLEAERSFIADAAHELRTPIAAMRVNVEALQIQTHSPLGSGSPRAQELLSGMLRSADRAARLVAQLLSLMRSESQVTRAAPELLVLDELAQDRLALLSQVAESRCVELSLQSVPSLRLRAERERFISMLDNLIDNAIKYSPARGVVQVCIEQQGEQACVIVQDQGPGIPPIWHERAFDRFFRAPDQSQSGSGLGLAIVKSVVDHLGGRIVLSGRQDGESGLCVKVWLPLQS